jgi:hypothetical protein
MAKATDADKLAEEIVAMMPPSNRSRPWWEKVDPKHAATLDLIFTGWLDGRYGPSKSRAAKGISAFLHSKGIATVGQQGVSAWLNARTS